MVIDTFGNFQIIVQRLIYFKPYITSSLYWGKWECLFSICRNSINMKWRVSAVAAMFECEQPTLWDNVNKESGSVCGVWRFSPADEFNIWSVTNTNGPLFEPCSVFKKITFTLSYKLNPFKAFFSFQNEWIILGTIVPFMLGTSFVWFRLIGVFGLLGGVWGGVQQCPWWICCSGWHFFLIRVLPHRDRSVRNLLHNKH